VASCPSWAITSSARPSARFEHKGRFYSYLSAIPTFVILADYPALRGLAVAINSAD
jgi:glucokinase